LVFYMPGRVETPQADGAGLLPRQIVAELDRFIVGQSRAKRAVAIALRNRMRRRKLPPEVAEEVMPKNILMIGPTGVGKTEIARRLARRGTLVWVTLGKTEQRFRKTAAPPRRRGELGAR